MLKNYYFKMINIGLNDVYALNTKIMNIMNRAHGQPVTDLENRNIEVKSMESTNKKKRNICFTHPPPQLE